MYLSDSWLASVLVEFGFRNDFNKGPLVEFRVVGHTCYHKCKICNKVIPALMGCLWVDYPLVVFEMKPKLCYWLSWILRIKWWSKKFITLGSQEFKMLSKPSGISHTIRGNAFSSVLLNICRFFIIEQCFCTIVSLFKIKRKILYFC